MIQKVRESKEMSFGYSAATDVYEGLVKAGVIDPTKVVRTALQNAASIATLLLTTEAVISEIPGPKKASHGGGRPSSGRKGGAIDSLNEIVVVPVTRTVRGIATEVLLSVDDDMPTMCALNLDHVALAQRARLGPLLSTLRESRWVEVERALLVACGFDRPPDRT